MFYNSRALLKQSTLVPLFDATAPKAFNTGKAPMYLILRGVGCRNGKTHLFYAVGWKLTFATFPLDKRTTL